MLSRSAPRQSSYVCMVSVPRGAGIEPEIPVQQYRQYMAQSHERCDVTLLICRGLRFTLSVRHRVVDERGKESLRQIAIESRLT